MKHYISLELKYESVIFPALSGIAGLVHQATGDGHVAGLWRTDLHRGSLRQVEEPGKRMDVWRAPS